MASTQKKEQTFIGLDIGTSKVVCVVGLQQEEAAVPSIIGLGVAPNAGLRRGSVSDVEETVSAITAALEEAERMSGVAIERATVNVDATSVQSLNSHGVVAVARADRQIGAEDLARAEQAASAIQLDANREILQIIPCAYHVDDQHNVEDPVGMNGIKLEIDTHIITASTPALKNLQNAVFRSGVAIDGQVITPLAGAQAVVSEQQRQSGVIFIHFGSETTGIAVYEKGLVRYSAILPLGSNNVTKDLAYGLRIPHEVAEKIKIDYGVAKRPHTKTSQKIDLEEYGASGNIYQHDIDTIVTSRLEEIFAMVLDELQKAEKSFSHTGAGVVLSGGGANMAEIGQFVSELFHLPVRIGKVTGYSGVADKIDDPCYSVAVGLMLCDIENPSSNRKRAPGVFSGLTHRLKSIFKSLLP